MNETTSALSRGAGAFASDRCQAPGRGSDAVRKVEGACYNRLSVMECRPKVLLVQTVFSAHGGAAAVAAWIVEALKVRYDLTLLTWRPADLERMNTTYGTNLNYEDVRWVFPNPIARRLVELIPDNTWDWQKR